MLELQLGDSGHIIEAGEKALCEAAPLLRSTPLVTNGSLENENALCTDLPCNAASAGGQLVLHTAAATEHIQPES